MAEAQAKAKKTRSTTLAPQSTPTLDNESTGGIGGGVGAMSPSTIMAVQGVAGNQAALSLMGGRGGGAPAAAPVQRQVAVQREEDVQREGEDDKEEGAKEDDGLGMASTDGGDDDDEGGMKLGIEGTGEVDEETGEEDEDSRTTIGFDREKGASVKNLKPWGEGGPTLDLSKDEQALNFEVPGTKVGVPPPDGQWKAGIDAKIPFPPPASFLGVSVGAGVEGGLKLNGVTLSAKHQRAVNKATTAHTFSLNGGAEAEASVGGFVSVAIYGGIPYVVTAEAGLKATATASLKLAAAVTGTLTAQYTNPAPDSDDDPQLIGLLGELSIEVKGTGDLEAALKAYLAGQIFMFKGEFFSFDIASAKLARLRAGGRLGWRFQDAGEAKFFKEPTNPSGNWVDFNWILGEILESRKMDKAQARLKAAAADVQALQDLQAFFDAPQDGRPMRQRLAGKSRELLVELNRYYTQYDGLATQKENLEAEVEEWDQGSGLVNLFAEEGDRQRRMGGLRQSRLDAELEGRDDEKKKVQKQIKALEKQMLELEGKIAKTSEAVSDADTEFFQSITPDNIEESIAKAQKALEKQRKENMALMRTKLQELGTEINNKRTTIGKQIKDNTKITSGYQTMLANSRRRRNDPATAGYEELLKQLQTKATQLQNDLEELDAEFIRRSTELQKLVDEG